MTTSRPSPTPDMYEAFVEILVRHEPALRSYVRTLVQTWDDVDEVVQKTCVALWRKFPVFQQGSNFLSWACTMARFEVLKLRRSRARDRHVFGDELIELLADEGADEMDRRELERQALDSCIERLSENQRELIRRSYSAGVNIKEVAATLGISDTALYKTLNRIRQALLACIEQTISRELAL